MTVNQLKQNDAIHICLHHLHHLYLPFTIYTIKKDIALGNFYPFPQNVYILSRVFAKYLLVFWVMKRDLKIMLVPTDIF